MPPYLLVNRPNYQGARYLFRHRVDEPWGEKIGSTVRSQSKLDHRPRLASHRSRISRDSDPAISEMSVFGHQQSFVLAEDEEESPWNPTRGARL